MSPAELKHWLEIISGFFGLFVAAIAALWAYAKLVLERGFLPPLQFFVSCRVVTAKEEDQVIEVAATLKNLGSSTAVIRNLRIDIRYLTPADALILTTEQQKPAFGRLLFPNSVRRKLGVVDDNERGFQVVAHDTFVQPGIEQMYPFVTAVPRSSTVLVWSAFEYAQKPSGIQQAVLSLSRALGLVQFTLGHISKPHTAEGVFAL